MNAIKIKNLKKYFLGGRVKAVDNISIDVPKGEVFGFLGPNGAGKSTTIRCMMDYIRPTSGQILINGQDAHYTAKRLKKDIGFLDSNEILFENWTGQDHIRYSESVNGKSKILSKLITDFDLDVKRRYKNLSTGNKRKLSIILALMHKPSILILDEPTNGLDPLLQNKFYEIIQGFNKEGTTVFMSSHYLAEVERICKKVSIIRQGKIVATESISNLKAKKIYNVEVSFDDKFDIKSFDDKDTEIITSSKISVNMQVKKDINKLVKKLSKYEVKNLEITHASLEDIFLEYYKK